MKRGMIPEIQDAVVKMYVKRQRKRAGRRRSQSHNPVVAAGIDKENVKLEAMKTAKAKKASKKKAKATKGASNGK